MREDSKVRIIKGEYKGQTGTVIGPIRTIRGVDLPPEGDINDVCSTPLWVIEFADGSQYALQESDFEVIDD